MSLTVKKNEKVEKKKNIWHRRWEELQKTLRVWINDPITDSDDRIRFQYILNYMKNMEDANNSVFQFQRVSNED